MAQEQSEDDEVIQWFWSLFAWLVSRPLVADWLIARAQRTPYTHLPGYMNRYWLFNPYAKVNGREVSPISWLPSVRIHHILREDLDRHMHDHPWDARTVILRGWYAENRVMTGHCEECEGWVAPCIREAGDTAAINFGQYHTIFEVSPRGVWTLFITFGYQGTWGFEVDGVKVPWREYFKQYPQKPWAQDDREVAQ